MRSNDAAAMKILWVFENPDAGDLLGSLTIMGRDLAGMGRTYQAFPRSRGTDYPSIIDIPTAGCWQLRLQIKSLAAGAALATGVVTMIVAE